MMQTDPHLAAYRLFCAAQDRLARWRGQEADSLAAHVHHGWSTLAEGSGRSLIVYAATIGEFNALSALIAAYRARWPDDRLILVTAQVQYVEPLTRAHPDAAILTPHWRAPAIGDHFVALARPRLAVFGEGPSLHGHFPIRLELPFVTALLRHAVPAVVANARDYPLSLQSRIDVLEHKLFAGLHRRAIVQWFTPAAAQRQGLIAAGVPAARVQAVGDLKFDVPAPGSQEPGPELAAILDGYAAAGRPVVVGGSVNERDEQELFIDAFRRLRARCPEARLVIAPRYPNRRDVMGNLTEILDASGLDWGLRSRQRGAEAAERDVLVIDVFGELRAFYRIATVGYVGRNHGVLEPVLLHKPTVAATGWGDHHSSYPLYRQVVEEGALLTGETADDLAALFARLLTDGQAAAAQVALADAVVARESGGAERTMAACGLLLDWRPAPVAPLSPRREALAR